MSLAGVLQEGRTDRLFAVPDRSHAWRAIVPTERHSAPQLRGGAAQAHKRQMGVWANQRIYLEWRRLLGRPGETLLPPGSCIDYVKEDVGWVRQRRIAHADKEESVIREI